MNEELLSPKVVRVFKDTASGINDKRKNFWKMMEFIKENHIPFLIVEFHEYTE